MRKIILVIVILLLIGGGFYYYKNNEQLGVQFETIEQNEGWKTYTNKKYGFSFSYPQNFQVVTDKIHMKYIGHPNGFNWYRIELTDPTVKEEPFIQFEIDADGYGPFVPDKTYQINENSENGITIVSVDEKQLNEQNNNGKILIIPNNLKAKNGHTYSWQFSFNKGGNDYEPLFKKILNTFRFIY